jgi:hypothetical protein
VYHFPYPCKKFSAWWVVHKVNPHEWLHIPYDVGYYDTPSLDGDIEGVYQEEELPTSFIVEHDLGLDGLAGDADDIQTSENQKQKPSKKKIQWSSLRSRVQDRDTDEF